jgi:hypothetical protein
VKPAFLYFAQDKLQFHNAACFVLFSDASNEQSSVDVKYVTAKQWQILTQTPRNVSERRSTEKENRGFPQQHRGKFWQ